MLFKFLTYTSPVSYFNLIKHDGNSVFPKWESVPKVMQDCIQLDTDYSCMESTHLDASWQLVQKGYVAKAETLKLNTNIPVIDEYRFIRKNFNLTWVYYTLLIRLLSFYNPLKELKAFFKTNSVKRINVYKNPIKTENWDTFKSNLMLENPKISVIIPTLNRYAYLKNVLHDLEAQNYPNFEVLVVDQSEPFEENFYKEFNLDIQVSYQKEKALWLARNSAIKKTGSEYILLFDDDSRVEKDWIQNHLKCLDFFNADISSGTSIAAVGAKIFDSYGHFKISDQIDTGNVLIKKSVFKELGLFDRQFEKQRMGDGEFGLRAYLASYLNISNPYAQRLHLKVKTGGLRQLGSWDAMRPVNWFAPRPIPSVLYLYRTYFGPKLTRYALLKSVPPSFIPYKYKKNTQLLMIGFLGSILLFPLVLLQVYRSWSIASNMLKEGPKIEKL